MMRVSLDLLSSSKRRSRLEIYIDVLRIIGCGVNKPTRIMFAANLSWKSLNEVLSDLERHGLIERRIIKNRVLILITEKGKRVLRNLETISAELTAPIRLERYA
ncbi:MAG: hypothetical protein N3E47_02410 [Candidatus Bathyarchaeota archaeon]|nr:hypothetical protein [Candidatus Bathyarchaeota archaeon]